MTDTIPADLRAYASVVGRHLRDRPDEERQAIEDDLARHLHELGHTDMEQCRQELGPPEAYAAQLREALDLPAAMPAPRFRRRIAALAAGLALAVAAAAAAWWMNRPFDPPVGFRALTLASGATWNESGTSVGNGLRISVDQGGVAGLAFTLENTSGHELEVHAIRADEIGVGDSGETIAPGDPGFFDSAPDGNFLTTSEIWDTAVEVADPDEVEVLAPTGGAWWREFEPFSWEPGRSLAVRFSGPVIACDSEAIDFEPGPATGGGRKIVIEYSIDGRDRSEELGSYIIDFVPCLPDGS